MKKNALLLGLSISLTAGVIGVAAFAGNTDAFKVGKTVATDPEYTLTIDSDNLPVAIPKRDSAFSVTSARGTNLTLLKTPNTHLNTSEGVVLRVSTVPSAPSVLVRTGDNDLNPDEYYEIHGLKTFSMTFTGTTPYITYGFMHDNRAYYTYQETLTSGAVIDFNGLLPSVFCVISEGTTEVSSINITYSCSPSNTCKNAWINSYFDATPKNIVRDGEDVVASFESGAYPQSRADIYNHTWDGNDSKAYQRSAEGYLEDWYQDPEFALTPIFNGYYISRFDGQGYVGDIDDFTPAGVKLYHRQQVGGSGFDNEFTAGNYYWFEVEPLTWKVSSHNGNEYVAYTEKVIRGGVQYHNNNGVQNVVYNDSTLKTFIDGLFSELFINPGNDIKENESFNNSRLYALRGTEYGANTSARIAEYSVFGRSFGSRNTSSGTTNAMYWTNRIGYSNYDNKGQYVDVNGNLQGLISTTTSGVRPGMTITIA